MNSNINHDLSLPCLPEGITTKDAFDVLDEEVLKHQMHILNLKNRRNTYAPVSQLPPEIIIKIFELVKQEYESLKWITVSHVCRSWRDIMLDTASFWTTLPLGSPDLTAAMIARSKSARLNVRVNFCQFSRPIQMSTALAAIRLLPRIQKLAIECYENHKDSMQAILDDLPKEAPALESLIIKLYDDLTESNSVTLPDLSLCDMELLERLEAVNCRLNWGSHLHNKPFLKYLKLQDVSYCARPAFNQFWNSLKEMPALEFLFLDNVFSDCDSFPDTIHLANLQCLVLNAPSNQVALFLETVTFPPAIPVELTCRGRDVPACKRVLRALSSTILSGSLNETEIQGLELSQISYEHEFALDAYYPPLSEWETYEVHGHRINSSLRVLFPTEPDDTPGISAATLWEPIFSDLPLAGVRTVSLKLWQTISAPSKIIKTLSRLPYLQSIDMHSCRQVVRDIIVALQKPSSTNSNSPSFPSLTELTMRCIHFDEVQHEDSALTVEMLLDCLIWRYECGVEVERLAIFYCPGLEGDNIALVEEVVTDVKWDGSYLDDDFYDDEDDYEDYEGDEDDYNYDWGSDHGYRYTGNRFYEYASDFSDPEFSTFDY